MALAPGTRDAYASIASSSGDWLEATALSCDQTVIQVNLSLLGPCSVSMLSMVLPRVGGMLGRAFSLPPSTELAE
jgi:hypothetical protein